MIYKRIIIKSSLTKLMLTGVFVFTTALSVSAQKNVEVVETKIDFDQMVPEIKKYSDPDAVRMEEAGSYSGIKVRGDEVILLNDTLKRAIEENEKLIQQYQKTFEELKLLRGQRQVEKNRIETITDEIRSVRDQMDEIIGLNRKYSRQVVELRTQMSDRSEAYEKRISQMQTKLNEVQPVLEVADEPKYQIEVDVMEMVDDYNRESQRLKEDTARVHYNMGNVLYHRGEYRSAVREYKRALELLPSDASTHFNLAYVSGEFIRDYATAIEHYREYLVLNPAAEDSDLVRNKILEAQLVMDTVIPSPLEGTVNKTVRPNY